MINDLSQNIIINITLNECYICYEECLHLSPCDCKTLYIHKECFKKLINKNKEINCKICKKKYENITVEIIYKSYITLFGKRFIYKNTLLIITIICFAGETYIGIINNIYILIASGILLIAIIILMHNIILNIIFMRRNNIHIIKKKEVKKNIFINEK